MSNGVTTNELNQSHSVSSLLGNSDGKTVQIAIEVITAIVNQSIPGPNKATRAEISVDLEWPNNTLGAVWGDPDQALNGIYRKSGDFGHGNWARIGDLPLSVIGQAVLSKLVKVENDISELRVNLSADGLLSYTGQGPKIPLFALLDDSIIFGWDDERKSLYGKGILTQEDVRETIGQILAAHGVAAFTGDGPIIPFALDAQNRVVQGINTETGQPIGFAPSQATVSGLKVNEASPLPQALHVTTAHHNGLICYGQSLSVGAKATPVVSTLQPYSNRTFAGGPRAYDGSAHSYLPLKDLVEDAIAAPDGSSNRGETPCSGAANFASTLFAQDGGDPNAHIILASAAGHGGYRIDQLEKGSTWYGTLLNHITQAHAAHNGYALHAIYWLQGENDVAAGTSYATYRAKLAQLQADIEADAKAITGQTGPVFMITYQLSYGAASHPDIALAQLDLCQTHDRFYLATPLYPIPHDGDYVHLDDGAASKRAGVFCGRVYKHLVIDKTQGQWINCKAATLRGQVVTVKFDVPVEPLVLDTETLSPTADFGFKVTADGSDQAISAIAASGNEVTITLAAVPSGALELRYGLDHLAVGLTITNGASGNLRDSAPDTAVIDGATVALHHACPHFKTPVTKLGE